MYFEGIEKADVKEQKWNFLVDTGCFQIFFIAIAI
jgi:hypothetical protein